MMLCTGLIGRLRRKPKPDPFLIHEMEYRLGLRDDPPPIGSYSDAPGGIVFYQPIKGQGPTFDTLEQINRDWPRRAR